MHRCLVAVIVSFAVSFTFSTPAWAQPGNVELKQTDNTVEVSVGGTPFTTLHFDKAQAKPYFHPVLAADGALICRPLENPEDHPHHKGIWCSIDEVNGIKFWAEKGKIVNHEISLDLRPAKPPSVKAVNHWLGEDGQPILIETVEYAFFSNRLLAYDATFTAADKSVTFDDTKEGMFGIRLANSMRGSVGGQILNSDGRKTEAECWGRESKWVDYVGTVNGKTYGVTLMEHPRNFHRSRYHVRNYGLFTVSPFGQHAYTNGILPKNPFNTLEPGKSFRLRYALFVHEGNTDQGNVAIAYDSYVKTTSP